MPPKRNPRRANRAVPLTSMPLYTREFVSDHVKTLFTMPSLFAFRLYIVMVCPPPSGRFAFFGIVIVNGV